MAAPNKMRILKTRSNYLERKASKNLLLGMLFLIPFLVLLITSIDILPFYIDLGRYETSRGLLLGLLFILGSLFLMYPYRKYTSGLIGEKKVSTIFSETLGEEYSLQDDVTLDNMGRGNIDHIVVGPTGVFAIETKNNKGKISCYGDNWEGVDGQPSRQVRINAVKIRKILDISESFKPRAPYVQGVVVFADNRAEFIERKPPENVKVVRIDGLADFIMNSLGKLSPREVESIEKVIQENTRSNSTD